MASVKRKKDPSLFLADRLPYTPPRNLSGASHWCGSWRVRVGVRVREPELIPVLGCFGIFRGTEQQKTEAELGVPG